MRTGRSAEFAITRSTRKPAHVENNTFRADIADAYQKKTDEKTELSIGVLG